MALVRSSTEESLREEVWLQAVISACTSKLLKSTANQIAEMAVPMIARMNCDVVGKLFLQHVSDLVLGFDKMHRGMLTHTHAHTESDEKGLREGVFGTQRAPACCLSFLNIASYFILYIQKKGNQSFTENSNLSMRGVCVLLF